MPLDESGGPGNEVTADARLQLVEVTIDTVGVGINHESAPAPELGSTNVGYVVEFVPDDDSIVREKGCVGADLCGVSFYEVSIGLRPELESARALPFTDGMRQACPDFPADGALLAGSVWTPRIGVQTVTGDVATFDQFGLDGVLVAAPRSIGVEHLLVDWEEGTFVPK